ncbi:MAG: GAF domain-containing protein [Anaerolineae bacterium]|nr:GAF domain-containing protein [Anaerolineae bacterium]
MDRTLHSPAIREQDLSAVLVRRNRQLEVAAQLARLSASGGDLNHLLADAARLLRERLDLSFVGFYLIDDLGRYLVLRAGAGELGQSLLQQGYQIDSSDESALSLALRAQEPVFVQHGISAAQPYARTLLPVTPGAAVIPLKTRRGVLGVWTAHTDHPDLPTRADAEALLLIGDNLAIAIENAELSARANSNADATDPKQHGLPSSVQESRTAPAHLVYSKQTDSFADDTTDETQAAALASDAANTSALSVPITLRGQVIGAVDLFDVTQPRNWDDNDKALASSVVEQLALAVENARLFQQAEQRARETQIINEMASAISGELDARRVYETVYKYLPRLMPTDAFLVWLYDDQTRTVTRPALYDLGEYYPDDEGPRAPAGTVARVVDSRAPVAINNTRAAWELEREQAHLIIGSSEPSASRLYVPLRVGSRLRGIMSVQTYEFDAYGSPQVALLVSVANTVATALENAQLFAETNNLFNQAQQALAETRLLYSTSGQLNQVTSLEELVRIAAQPAFAQGAGSAQLLLIEYQGQNTPVAANVIVSLVSPGVPAPLSQFTHFPIDQYALGQTMLANPRELVIIEDVAVSPLDQATRHVLLSSRDHAIVLMPLTVEQRVLGAIAIGWATPHHFTDQERRIYQSLAGQLALVLNNRLLFEQTEQALAETQTLYEISARLNAANNLQESLEAAAGPAIVQGALSASLLHVIVQTDGTVQELETAVIWPRSANRGFPIGSRLSRENIAGAATWLDRATDPLLVENINGDERVSPAARANYARNAIQSTALLPLRIGERWVGLLTFDWQEPHSFTPRDLRLFRSIMAQAATVLDNRRAEEAIRQQNTYLTALHDTTLGLMRRLNLEELLQNIITRAGELVGTEHGYVHLIEPNGVELRMRVGVGVYHDFIGTVVKPGQGLAGTVWSSQEAIVVDDYRKWPGRLPMVDRDVLRAVAGVPLKSGGSTVGVLGLASLQDERRFGAAQIEALHRFAELAAVALDNAQLYDATRQALEQTQRVAQREKASAEIADKLYAAPDVQSVLRTAARELRQSTGSRRAIVRLKLGQDGAVSQDNGKHEPGGSH